MPNVSYFPHQLKKPAGFWAHFFCDSLISSWKMFSFSLCCDTSVLSPSFTPWMSSCWKESCSFLSLCTNIDDLFGLQCFQSKSTVILSVPWISAPLRISAFPNSFTVYWVFSCLYKCHWTIELTLPRYAVETLLHCFLYSSWFYYKLWRNSTFEPLSNFLSLQFCFMVFTYENCVTFYEGQHIKTK